MVSYSLECKILGVRKESREREGVEDGVDFGDGRIKRIIVETN